MNELERQAKQLLDKANIKYERVYQYAGCSETCGPMPRVIVCFANRIDTCYHLDELIAAIENGTLERLQ